MEIIVFIAIILAGVLMFGGISTRASAPRRRTTTGKRSRKAAKIRNSREYREAAREAKQFHDIQEDVYQRMDRGRKRKKYVPDHADIMRRMNERRSD